MSLDIYLTAARPVTVFDANITHNLNNMADEAGIYDILWHPDENGIETAEQLIEPLRAAIEDMETNPKQYKQFNAQNGWGTYKQFLPWLRRLLKACKENPDATVSVWI